MENNSRKNKIIFFFSIIALLGAAAVLHFTRADHAGTTTHPASQTAVAWTASYNEADFSSSEIRELVRRLQQIMQADRDAEMLRPVIIQLGVHLRNANDPVPLVVADLLRDLSVEHPVKDIR
ncbi:MAG: hypothetical protein EA363_13575, partial [Balneolaceae bacterium]